MRIMIRKAESLRVTHHAAENMRQHLIISEFLADVPGGCNEIVVIFLYYPTGRFEFHEELVEKCPKLNIG